MEWLHSDIVYKCDGFLADRLRQLTPKTNYILNAKLHYYGLARGQFGKFVLSQPEVRLKKYMYAIRPALALIYLYNGGEIVPMNFLDLFEQVRGSIPENVYDEISKILDLKRSATEDGHIPHNRIVDDFISQVLESRDLGKGMRPTITDDDLNNILENYFS